MGLSYEKLGALKGTGGRSGGGDDTRGGATELHGWLSSYKGRRPIGTLFKNCACGRRANGSGNWGAVNSER